MATTNEMLVRRLFEDAWNRGDEQALDELLTCSDRVIRSNLCPDNLHIATNIRMLRTAFPDWQVTIDMLISMPDRVLTQWHAGGTHLGPFMGLAPTGRCVHAHGTSIFYIFDGQIQDARVSRDSLSMLQQVCMALTSKAPVWAAAPDPKPYPEALVAIERGGR